MSNMLSIDDLTEFRESRRIKKRLILTENMTSELLCYEPGQGTHEELGSLLVATYETDGWRFAGQWNDSVFVGFGIAEGTDGTYMAGEWYVPRGTALTDGLNGYGQILAADGSDAFGLFANSILQPWGR